jgi:hypothetical protein
MFGFMILTAVSLLDIEWQDITSPQRLRIARSILFFPDAEMLKSLSCLGKGIEEEDENKKLPRCLGVSLYSKHLSRWTSEDRSGKERKTVSWE